MRLRAAASTHPGRVRDGNEDRYLLDERLTLFAVADGMGGHRGGEVASATAIEALRAAVAGGAAIPDAVESANQAVLDTAARDAALAGMGTTLTAVTPVGETAVLIGHVGDSRAYLLRDDDQGLRRLTEDHSLVEELVREGRLTREQAEVHPQRAIITRALGVEPGIEVDLYTVEVRSGDRIVICSDGLTTMVREREVERILRGADDPQRAADLLVDAANAAGGEDNVTVVVLAIHDVDAPAPPDPEALAEASPPATPAPVAAPEPEVDATEPPVAAPVLSRRRRLAGVLLLVIPLVAIGGLAFGVLGWYARNSYYVGLHADRVVLYRGHPGGILGWDPTVEDGTPLRADDLTPADRAALEDGAGEGSRAKAERYLEALLSRSTTTTTTTTTTTSTSTTTSTTTTPASTTTAGSRGAVPTTAPATPTSRP